MYRRRSHWSQLPLASNSHIMTARAALLRAFSCAPSQSRTCSNRSTGSRTALYACTRRASRARQPARTRSPRRWLRHRALRRKLRYSCGRAGVCVAGQGVGMGHVHGHRASVAPPRNPLHIVYIL
ncbi:hypothetical protein PsYK624_033460 [Phanerochaete sordida]|uniref:Uncharacterized protein n=1 Tax=Phanerochaete sordida TaxID=48140 RepID=A0A9P3G2W0_9APHY|nr:hypothetical protein PsYK624_033460 [Phanerochaete sordida]